MGNGDELLSDFGSALSCAATSKMMLHHTMPLVTFLHVDKSSQMNKVASRFRDVREIHINSVLTPDLDADADDEPEMNLDRNTVLRAVPFLANFPNLERVHFGGRASNGEAIGFDSTYVGEDERDNMESTNMLVDNLSGAFQLGSISNHLEVLGLRCVRSYAGTNDWNDGISTCEVCERACRSFPINQV